MMRLTPVPFVATGEGPDNDRLDRGVAYFVNVLRVCHDIATHQACEGGAGHCHPVPTIDFSGDSGEGLRALGACLARGFPVRNLARVWEVWDGGIQEVFWRLTFDRQNTEEELAALPGIIDVME